VSTLDETCDLCEEYATQQFEQGGECHTLCDACEKETRPEPCLVCGDEMVEHHDNLRPTWSDTHDNTVCWWCATHPEGVKL
jgi:hypothetical protein